MNEGWSYKKLGEVCEIYNGNSINADYKKKFFSGRSDGYPFIATKDISITGVVDYDNGVRIPNYEDYKTAPPNSVFVCAEGGSAGKKCAFISQNVCFGNKLFCLVPKDNAVEAKFVYYFVQSDVFKDSFHSLLSGLIGGVSSKKFQTIQFHYPSLSEQHSIVSRLDTAFSHIDTLKANAEKQLNEARKLFQAELTECMKPKEGWEKKKLGEITVSMADGPFGSNLKKEHYTTNKEVRIIQLSNIGEEGWREENTKYTTFEHLKTIQRSEVKPGDVVIAKMMPAGRAILCPDNEPNYVLSSDAVRATLKEGLDKRFVCLAINSSDFRKQVYANVSGSGRVRTSLTKLRNCKLHIPSLPDQQLIVSHLDSLSSTIRKLEELQQKTLTECDALKQAMLREVFE